MVTDSTGAEERKTGARGRRRRKRRSVRLRDGAAPEKALAGGRRGGGGVTYLVAQGERGALAGLANGVKD